MAELAIITASSLFPSSSAPAKNPPPPPNSRRRPPLHPVRRPPLLSDTRLGLTAANPLSPPPASTRHILKYYAHLASKLARDGRLRDFLMIAESVLASNAVAADRPQFVARIHTRMVAAGVASALRGGKLDEVLDFLSGAERLGVCPSSLFDDSAREALAVECLRLVRDGRLEEFVDLMETLAGYRFFIRDIVDPVGILKLFVEKHDPEMAIRYASIFPHSQLLLCSIIQEFGMRKDMASAIKVFEASKQRSDGINMFACRNIIDVCGSCGNYLKSRSIFEDLLARKITPNIYVFNSLMNVNAHDLSYTLYVYKHMQDLGIVADLTSYNILLKACCNAKRVDLAQDIYKEVKQMESKGALKLDVITYSSMIKVFANTKMWQMALSIKEDMLLANVTPNVVTWSSLVSAFSNAGLVDRAVQVFEEMLLSGCEPNAQCCNVVLYAYVASCQFDRAFRFFHDWKESRLMLGNAAKPRNCEDRNAGLTVKHVSRNVSFRPTVATYNILMKACGTDYHHAKALMDEMKMMGLCPNHISWTILIDIYGNSKNMRDAMEVFESMRDVGMKLDVIAYTTAIKVCIENKNLKLAFSLFRDMKRYKVQPNLVTYNTLLRARSRYGSLYEIQQCLAIYQDMRKSGYSANDYYLKELIEEWCEGVICRSNQNQGQLMISKGYKKSENSKPHNLLLEKVATHLQKDGDNQAIDIRGLSKVESRIVVLSVLRMIKESYQLGEAVKDDMIIIYGTGKESSSSTNQWLEVRHSIVKVLRDELGLHVITGHGSAFVDQAPNSHDVTNDYPINTEKTDLQKDYKHLARRPEDLGLLKVTRKSIYNWLQKRLATRR